jgi:hypothetical protein
MYFDYKTNNIYPLKIKPIPQYDDIEERKRSILEKVHKKIMTSILVYDLQGKFIGEYESQGEVKRKLNVEPSSVLRGICSQMKGYTFKYKDPNYKPKKYNKRKLATSI